MKDLWTPTQTTERKVLPTERKDEGGTYFDDELVDEAVKAKAYADEVTELLNHLAQRPDHTVYVGSADERAQMRTVFNHWYRQGALTYHPNIRIDYGIAEGAIRVGE